jgi:hypothetical protein
MLSFSFTLVAVALGVAAYAHYNPGTTDVTLYTYRFVGIADWELLAVAAGAPLVPFLLHAITGSVRVRRLRRGIGRFTTGRTFDDLPTS